MSLTDERDVVELGLLIEDADGAVRFTGGSDGRAFFLGTAESDELFQGTPATLALQLAMLVGLGPRPRDPRAVALLDGPAIESPTRSALQQIWFGELVEGTPIAADGWTIWTAYAAWVSPDGAEQTAEITVVDGGADGMARVLGTDASTDLLPITPTEVWTLLCGLLPGSAVAAAGVA